MIVLIESDWNLKDIPQSLFPITCLCINRIRLEFKAIQLINLLKKKRCINRIRLEFKGNHTHTKDDIGLGINRIRLEFKGYIFESCRTHKSRINRIRLEFKVNSYGIPADVIASY